MAPANVSHINARLAYVTVTSCDVQQSRLIYFGVYKIDTVRNSGSTTGCFPFFNRQTDKGVRGVVFPLPYFLLPRNQPSGCSAGRLGTGWGSKAGLRCFILFMGTWLSSSDFWRGFLLIEMSICLGSRKWEYYLEMATGDAKSFKGEELMTTATTITMVRRVACLHFPLCLHFFVSFGHLRISVCKVVFASYACLSTRYIVNKQLVSLITRYYVYLVRSCARVCLNVRSFVRAFVYMSVRVSHQLVDHARRFPEAT